LRSDSAEIVVAAGDRLSSLVPRGWHCQNISVGNHIFWWLGSGFTLIGGFVLTLNFLPPLGFMFLLLPLFCPSLGFCLSLQGCSIEPKLTRSHLPFSSTGC